MSRSSSRLLATTSTQLSSLPLRTLRQTTRPFSQTCRRNVDSDHPPSLLDQLQRSQPQQAKPTAAQPPLSSTNSGGGAMAEIQRILATGAIQSARNQPTPNASASEEILGSSNSKSEWGAEPFHFHIYAHKHNAHITVTKPNRGAILSLSAGNIGFKKAKRGSYDAAYQLCAYVLDKLNQWGWHREITTLEVVLRGFGPGREAATKVLLGAEGRLLRDKISKVSDATRIKFGGTRSPKPRRLG
ncbi:Uu.00g012180.m01.CDS01 [Anthostomella pinea]|uniref:Uu.00g012180.m01.CDS01 n=1 Tax=Anthostomella pinea TaxID=933095 RepID=A0AAI8YQ29_9PEZI|nr:Uu.00g012180.m01.CDS01 [Anthostomella pinea]